MRKSNHLVFLWTCGDREVAEKMVLMYTLNGKLRAWWSEITLIIWGPSAKLLVEDLYSKDHRSWCRSDRL